MRKAFIGFLSIVLICVIVIVFYNYNGNEHEDSEGHSDIKEDGADSNGDMFVQFDKEFYQLEDISLDYAKAKTLKNTVKFSWDLDGDLVDDEIIFYKKDDFVYSVKLNGVDVLVNEYNPEIYIVDLNENDDKLEVVIFDEGPSWDLHYVVYSKVGNKLESLYDKRGDSLKCDKEGTVLVDDSSFEDFSPKLYFDYMYINDGVVVNKKLDLEAVSDIEFKNNKFYFSKDYDNKDKIYNINLDPTRLSEIGIEQLSDDIGFKILDVEYVNNSGFSDKKIKVRLSDNREGYIFMLYFAG